MVLRALKHKEAEEAKKWVRHPCSDLLFRTLQQPQPAKAPVLPQGAQGLLPNALICLARLEGFGYNASVWCRIYVSLMNDSAPM